MTFKLGELNGLARVCFVVCCLWIFFWSSRESLVRLFLVEIGEGDFFPCCDVICAEQLDFSGFANGFFDLADFFIVYFSLIF